MIKRIRFGSWLFPLLLVFAGVTVLVLWFRREPLLPLQKRIPGTDQPILMADGRREGPPGELERFTGRPAVELTSAWPGFRGPAGDGISMESIPLARGWDKAGPPVLWSVSLGEGYAGPAVAAGAVYLLDYDQVKKADALRCFSLADGKEIWRRSYPVLIKRQHGISRTVPAVAGRFVVTLGPLGHVMATDARNGDFLWGMDLVRDEGAKVPPWYAGQCPLIDRNRAILAPAGKNLLIAVDLATGKKVWTTPNPRQWKMTHSSILSWTLAGRRMYVYCADGGVTGVDAETGAMLWEFPGWIVPMANVPTPVAAGDGRCFSAAVTGPAASCSRSRRRMAVAFR